MTKTIKESGENVKVLKQYRNQSNNYKNNDSRVYADLFRVRFNNGITEVICETELD